MVIKKNIFKKQIQKKGGASSSNPFGVLAAQLAIQHGNNAIKYAKGHKEEISKLASIAGEGLLAHGQDAINFAEKHPDLIGGPGSSEALKLATKYGPNALKYGEKYKKEIGKVASIVGDVSLNIAPVILQIIKEHPELITNPESIASLKIAETEKYNPEVLKYISNHKEDLVKVASTINSSEQSSKENKIKFIKNDDSVMTEGSDQQNDNTKTKIEKLKELLIEKKKIINNKIRLINQQINLEKQSFKLNNSKKQVGGNKLENEKVELYEQRKNIEYKLEKLTQIQSKKNLNEFLENSTPEGGNFDLEKKTIGNIIKKFLKSDFFNFMVNYLFFIILFSICLYILLYINKNTNDTIIIIETKVFFYILLIFLFIVINDILATSQEGLIKFILIVVFSLIIIYICSNLIQFYYGGDPFKNNLLKVFCSTLIVYVIVLLLMFFLFIYKKKDGGSHLFHSFNNAFKKNYKFLIYLTIYVLIYKHISKITNSNTSLSDVLRPVLLGLFVLIFIFSMIIYLGLKLKIIKQISILNTFITLFSILFFLGTIFFFILMNSMINVCNGEPPKDTLQVIETKERITIGIIISLIIVLWLRDTRYWKQIGSIIFIVTTLFVLAVMFYYSTIYPSLSIVSLWLFFEWILLIFKQNENSKNSVHFSFMNL